MLMRTDPFRDLDRLAQQVLGTPSRPAAMPIDAYRHGDEFVVEFDSPASTPARSTHRREERPDRARPAAPQRGSTVSSCWSASDPRGPSAVSCSWAKASTPSASTPTTPTACSPCASPSRRRPSPAGSRSTSQPDGPPAAIDAQSEELVGRVS